MGDRCALVLGDADGLTLGDADRLALGDLTVAVGLGELLCDAEALAPGDNFGSVACGDPEQATTDPEATMAAKPAAASLTLNPVPAVVVRIVMGLLIPAADGGRFRARITTGTGGETPPGLPAACAGGRQIPGSANGD